MASKNGDGFSLLSHGTMSISGRRVRRGLRRLDAAVARPFRRLRRPSRNPVSRGQRPTTRRYGYAIWKIQKERIDSIGPGGKPLS